MATKKVNNVETVEVEETIVEETPKQEVIIDFKPKKDPIVVRGLRKVSEVTESLATKVADPEWRQSKAKKAKKIGIGVGAAVVGAVALGALGGSNKDESDEEEEINGYLDEGETEGVDDWDEYMTTIDEDGVEVIGD